MKITVVAVGKLKERYLKEGVEEYRSRLARYCEPEIVEVDDEPAPEGLSAAQQLQVKQKEAERIRKRIRPGQTIITLEIGGERCSSEDFARKLDFFFNSGTPHLTFIIGGSLGLHPELSSMAGLRLSLSDMTFPHQITRLVLLEQIYRAFKILKGEVYHK